MEFGGDSQPEWRALAIEQAIAQVERSALEIELAAIADIGDAGDVVQGGSAADLDAEVRQRHDLDLDLLREGAIGPAALAESTCRLGLEFALAGIADIGADHETEDVLGIEDLFGTDAYRRERDGAGGYGPECMGSRAHPQHYHGFDGVCHRSRGRSSVLLAVLFAQSAGVHVDFHADRHFHDLRSFPGHSGTPKGLSATSRRPKPRAASVTAQVWNRAVDTANCRIALANFSLGQLAFAPSQGLRFSPQQTQQRAAGARVHLLRIQRSILVGIRRVESLLHHREIFVERESPVAVGIGGGEFFRR